MPGSLELAGRQVLAVCEKVSDPFVVNIIRPMSTAQIGKRELQQQVTNRRRIQDTGIVNRRDIRHRVLQLITHVQYLGLAGQVVQRNHLFAIFPALVR